MYNPIFSRTINHYSETYTYNALPSKRVPACTWKYTPSSLLPCVKFITNRQYCNKSFAAEFAPTSPNSGTNLLPLQVLTYSVRALEYRSTSEPATWFLHAVNRDREHLHQNIFINWIIGNGIYYRRVMMGPIISYKRVNIIEYISCHGRARARCVFAVKYWCLLTLRHRRISRAFYFRSAHSETPFQNYTGVYDLRLQVCKMDSLSGPNRGHVSPDNFCEFSCI